MGKILIFIGLTILIVGVVMYVLGNNIGGFGNLYGDIKIIQSNYKFYFPIASMLLISIILTIIINCLAILVRIFVTMNYFHH